MADDVHLAEYAPGRRLHVRVAGVVRRLARVADVKPSTPQTEAEMVAALTASIAAVKPLAVVQPQHNQGAPMERKEQNGARSVAIIPSTFAEVKQMSGELALSRLLPQALQKSPADVMLIIMAGAELGLGPMQSLRGMHVIQGKPVMSSDLMAALVLSRPEVCEYLQLVESTAAKATYETKRKGAPKPVTLAFTMEQAKVAGVTGKDNWKTYPDAMLRARALSAICRAVYPDLCSGVYDTDEVDAPPPRMVTSTVVGEPAPRASPPAAVDATPVTHWGENGEPLTPEAHVEVALREAVTADAVNGLVTRIKALPKGAQDTVRPLFLARLREVQAPVAVAP